MYKNLDRYAKLLAKKIRDNEFAVFAGAGLSAGAGFVNWGELLKPFAEDLGLNIRKESDNLVRLAQYSVNEKGGHRHHLDDALVKSFPVMARPGINHEILASMPINTYWTTNYDALIETALADKRKVRDVKWKDEHLPTSSSRRDAIVYKMHGDVGSPTEAVLTRDDYESFASKRPGIINALLGDLTVKTFLFVGFSFSDPNLDHVLSVIRQRYAKGQREHYCILRVVNKQDYENDSDYVYDLARQKFLIGDLKRFNITAILINEFAEITELLQLIHQYSRRDAVFVSGSVVDWTPWGEDEVNKFIASIGRFVVEKKGKVVSGLGVGVGNTIVAGAVEKAYSDGVANLSSYLEVRPFPQTVSEKGDRDKIWEAYRLELVRAAGIAVFIFGNKLSEDGTVVLADGMIKEFDLAIENGLAVVPIGGTGSAARELVNRALGEPRNSFKENESYRNLINAMNVDKPNLTDYLSDLFKLLGLLMVTR